MALRWLSNAFQHLLRLFSDHQPEEETPNEAHQRSTATARHREATPTEAHQRSTASACHREAPAGKSREPNEELFDNEWRRKAVEHAKLRTEFFKKAGIARKGGDRTTANEYVNKANQLTQKLNEANERAVQYIMETNPNNTEDTIDLHGLYVEEAMEQVENKLNTFRGGVLHIIPGRGSHSVNQQAKIKPKLIQYLQDNDYSNPFLLLKWK